MIQDKILNNFPVRKSDHRTGDADTSICVRFLSITINPQQSKKNNPHPVHPRQPRTKEF